MNDHKSLYKILQWMKYNISIPKNILKGTYGAKSYSKFDIILWIKQTLILLPFVHFIIIYIHDKQP